MHSVLAPLVDFRLSSIGALLVVLYGVVIGGAFGSFLNVVAYRLPLGMNLSRPGSRCPKCKRPIRPWHNIPVLGWLLLKGRCRDCGAAISPRYPIVELLVAAASGIVVWRSMTPELQGESTEYAINVLAVVLRLGLIYLLLTSALLEFDGSPLPLRLNATAALVLTAGALLVPELRPPQPQLQAALPSVGDLVFPISAAACLGLLSWPLMLLPPSATLASGAARLALVVPFAIVMGGLAVVLSLPAAAILMLIVVLTRRIWNGARQLGWAIVLLAVTLLWFVFAGPPLGSNEMVSFGDRTIRLEDPWMNVISRGLLTAGIVLTSRFVHWLLAAPTR